MVDAFENWCFDANRNPGDTGIVETTYGYHVMYFQGENLPLLGSALHQWPVQRLAGQHL